MTKTLLERLPMAASRLHLRPSEARPLIAEAVDRIRELEAALRPFVRAVQPLRRDGHHAFPLMPAADIERARTALANERTPPNDDR